MKRRRTVIKRARGQPRKKMEDERRRDRIETSQSLLLQKAGGEVPGPRGAAAPESSSQGSE